MARYSCTMMCDSRGPKDLVDDVAMAESVGFDFAVILDHYRMRDPVH